MTPHDIGNLFLRDYLIAMYIATLGVIQIGASYGGLRGMLFLPSPRPARWLGAALMVLGFLYFFSGPLWNDGPWGAASEAGLAETVTGRDGLVVNWDTAAWGDLGGAHNLNDVDGGLSPKIGDSLDVPIFLRGHNGLVTNKRSSPRGPRQVKEAMMSSPEIKFQSKVRVSCQAIGEIKEEIVMKLTKQIREGKNFVSRESGTIKAGKAIRGLAVGVIILAGTGMYFGMTAGHKDGYTFAGTNQEIISSPTSQG